ncbi:MAG: S41 family peptidase, partial [Clostridia bacterium]|nr:S41 family peptidase [Clostridia bacterium]
MTFEPVIGKVTPNSLDYHVIGDMGYVQIFAFDDGLKEGFDSILSELVSREVHGIIFDVRNTSGGNASAAIYALDKLLPKGNLVYTLDQKGEKETFSSDKDCISLPFAVLINKNTSFAAEIFAAVMKDYDAVLVGETTYGKSIEQKVLTLSGGSALLLSNKSYTPCSSPSFENSGVEPDVVCALGVENLYLIEHEDDAQIQAAHQALRNY